MPFEEFYRIALCHINTRGILSFNNIIKEEAESVYAYYKQKKADFNNKETLSRALNAVVNRAYFEINRSYSFWR